MIVNAIFGLQYRRTQEKSVKKGYEMPFVRESHDEIARIVQERMDRAERERTNDFLREVEPHLPPEGQKNMKDLRDIIDHINRDN